MAEMERQPTNPVKRSHCAEGQKELPTDLMLNELKVAPDLDGFLSKNKDAFYSRSISEHFDMLLKKYGVNKNEAIERADIERSYGYQILRGARDAKRDKYIRIAIGIGLDLDDTQRLLTVAKQGILYPKVLRDAVLIFCIKEKRGLLDIQCLLDGHNLEPLD